MEIPTADLIAVAIEHWRLSTWLATAGGNIGIARHSVRRIGDMLARWQIETQSLDGRPFDAGLAAKVVDTIDDPSAPKGIEVVCETVSPLVIWRGSVVRSAEVVVRRGTRCG
jgi:hypothetical protein